MQQEKDLILREIQRLNLFLAKLIEKVTGLEVNDYGVEFQKIEHDLENEFGFTIRGISQMGNSELLGKIENLHTSHIEKLTELIVMVLDKPPMESKNKLAEKALLMLNYLDKTSKTFSMERAELKNNLQQKFI